MPYLLAERKKALDDGNRHNLSEGDANYLFTRFFIDRWEKAKSYRTIAFFKKLTSHPGVDTEFGALNQEIRMSSILDDGDLEAARELAFYEFMRRVGNFYEDSKRDMNGDVYPNGLVVAATATKGGRK